MKNKLKLASLHSEKLSKEEKTKILGGAIGCSCAGNCGCECECHSYSEAIRVSEAFSKGAARAACCQNW